MMLRQRLYKKELLDQDDIPFKDIERNMLELNFINSKLGGHNISVSGLKQLTGANKQITVCEIGSGGGDNLRAMSAWCGKNGIEAKFIGIDLKEACTVFAQSRQPPLKDSSWITDDYRNVTFEEKPDIVFSSLFCHHFTDAQLLEQLRWMQQNSKLGFFINDLERNPIAYYLIKWLTRLFSSSYLVKNDAPLSVARGFKRKEWVDLLNNAGLNGFVVRWKWAFRYLVIFKHAR